MTKSNSELAIERVATIVSHLESEVAKEDPEAGTVFAILREQQKQSLEMWRVVLNALLFPTDEDKKRLEEDNKTIFRRYTTAELILSTLREENGAMRFYYERLRSQERLMRDVYQTTEKEGRTEHDRGVCNGLTMAVCILEGVPFDAYLLRAEKD